MHSQIVETFVFIGICVTILAIGGTSFEAMFDTPYLYKNVSKNSSG